MVFDKRNYCGPKCVDLFAGCGGLSYGLHAAGFQVVFANEKDKDAVNSYRNNFGRVEIDERDSRIVLEELISQRGNLSDISNDVDLIVGGPPCQGFSQINRYRSSADPRNSLIEVFLAFILNIRPKLVLMENVTGLLTLEGGNALNSIILELQSAGYEVLLGIFQAGHFGVSQNRWRVILSAKRQDVLSQLSFPGPMHAFHSTSFVGMPLWKKFVIRTPQHDLFEDSGKGLLPPTTVEDAIGDLPLDVGVELDRSIGYEIEAKSKFQRLMRGECTELYDHIAASIEDITAKRIEAIPEGGNWTNLPPELQPTNLASYTKEKGAFRGRYGRLDRAKHFSAIVTKPEPYWGRYIHPTSNRLISARECARAQTFSDVFRFSGAIGSRYRQIGNAVPPLLAYHLGRKLMAALGIRLSQTLELSYGKSFKT